MRATITSRARPSTIGSTTRSWSDGLLAFHLPSVPGTTKKLPRYRCSYMCTMLCLCEDLQARSWWVLEMYWEYVWTLAAARVFLVPTQKWCSSSRQMHSVCIRVPGTLRIRLLKASERTSRNLQLITTIVHATIEARDTSSTPKQRH